MSEEEFDIKRPAPASERKTRDLTALSKTILPITKNIFGKKGFMEIEILTNWDKIVGEELADYSFPQKIDFKRGEKNNGVLHLQVPSGAFALEIQHRERYILDNREVLLNTVGRNITRVNMADLVEYKRILLCIGIEIHLKCFVKCVFSIHL